MVHLSNLGWFRSPGSRLVVLVSLALVLAGCGGRSVPRVDAASPPDGRELFTQLECIHCHQMDGKGPGPSLVGLYGKTIPMEGGGQVTVDEAYLRTSILDPRAQTHAGYPPIMPVYGNRIDDAELAALVAYIRSWEE